MLLYAVNSSTVNFLEAECLSLPLYKCSILLNKDQRNVFRVILALLLLDGDFQKWLREYCLTSMPLPSEFLLQGNNLEISWDSYSKYFFLFFHSKNCRGKYRKLARGNIESWQLFSSLYENLVSLRGFIQTTHFILKIWNLELERPSMGHWVQSHTPYNSRSQNTYKQKLSKPLWRSMLSEILLWMRLTRVLLELLIIGNNGRGPFFRLPPSSP